MRYLRMTSILAVTFTTPAFAQQTNAADPQTWQQAEAILTQYTDQSTRVTPLRLGPCMRRMQ